MNKKRFLLYFKRSEKASDENSGEVTKWSRKWQLTLNAEKCKVMHLGKKNICYEYHLNDDMSTKQPFLENNLEKDL